MKILAVITARKGSKRLSNKNFRKIQGLSLTEYTVSQAALARDRGAVTDVVLSTDSEYLLEQCRKYGIVDLGLRPEALSGDQVKSVDVLLHIVEQLSRTGRTYDAVMTLQPTSPLRDAQDICQAAELFHSRNADSLITAAPIPNATINGLYLKTDAGFAPVSENHNSGQRHQTLQPVYLRNGAIFITKVSWMKEHRTVISTRPEVLEMPRERSVDVDDLEDLRRAEEYRDTYPVSTAAICETGFADQLPDIVTAMQHQYGCSRQIIWEDMFRLWLYGMGGGRSVPEHIAWTEQHIYFDGLAVLLNGECLNAQLLACADAIRSMDADPRLEAYLEQKISLLTKNTRSIRMKLAKPFAEDTPC